MRWLWSLVGAAVGYVTLWGVVEGGKLAFGKKRVVLPRGGGFCLAARRGARRGDGHRRRDASCGANTSAGEKDELVLHCDTLTLAGTGTTRCVLRCF